MAKWFGEMKQTLAKIAQIRSFRSPSERMKSYRSLWLFPVLCPAVWLLPSVHNFWQGFPSRFSAESLSWAPLVFGVSWNWGPFSPEDDREGRELVMDPSLSACTAERPPTEMQLGTGLCRHSCCRHPFTCLGEKSFLVGLPALLPGGVIYCLIMREKLKRTWEFPRRSKYQWPAIVFPSQLPSDVSFAKIRMVTSTNCLQK